MYEPAQIESWILSLIEDKFSNLLEKLADIANYPFLVTSPDNRIFSWWIVSYVLIGLILFAFGIKNYSTKDNGNFLRYLLPREIYFHRSAFVDLKLYVINRWVAFRVMSLLILVPGPLVMGRYIHDTLISTGGSVSGTTCTTCWPYYLLYSFCFLMALDFGHFISHYLHHKISFLWEFHKVHHSAAVLTPMTNFRFHPLEKITHTTIRFFCGATVAVLFSYFLFGKIEEANFFYLVTINMSIEIFAFNILANLRHSHIWLSYGYILNHILVSPAQHQIHHSCETRHLDTNFGLILGIWDWMFGTLYVPRRREEFLIGLTNREHEEYNTVFRLYTLPFVKTGKLLLAAVRRRYRKALPY